MIHKYKTRKIGIFRNSIFIRLSYPNSFKSYWNSYFLFFKDRILAALLLSLVFVLFGSGINLNQFKLAYYTKSTPFLKLISPMLVNIPEPPRSSVSTQNQKIVFKGPNTQKKVALTFDADMTSQMKIDLNSGHIASYYDKELINTLRVTGTKATLFLSGMWIESYADVARSLARNNLFELANHTYSHPAFEGQCYGLTHVRDSQKIAELQKTQKLLKDITGFDNKLFRFPGGCYSKIDLNTVKKTGQVAIQWDVAGRDGFNSDVANIVTNVVDNVKNGSIIVLHMNGYPNEPATAKALPLIISTLREKGYEFVTVSELLGIKNNKSLNIAEYINTNKYGL